TKEGTIKKTSLDEYHNIRKTGIIAINLDEDDELIDVRKTDGNKEIIVITKNGMAIRFHEKDVRIIGRAARGVKAITLNKDDNVVSMDLVKKDDYLVVISEKGYGKRTPMKKYKVQNRGGKGVKTYNIREKTGNLVSAKVISKEDEIMIISLASVIIRLKLEVKSEMGKSTKGEK